MKNLILVLKATMSGDMNIFNNKKNRKTKSGKNVSSKLIFLFFGIYLSGVAFLYANMVVEPLKSVNMTHVMLELFIVTVSILVLLECVYKSQGILFEAKDNDLLLSMPIEKKTIMVARIIKLLVFEYIFDFIFFIPAIIVYGTIENQPFHYWIVSTVMVITLPIIPTVFGSAIGYIIKIFSNKFKKGKAVQTITTIISTLGIIYFMIQFQSILSNLGNNAKNIDNLITNVYYPIKLYISLINEFNIVNFTILILLNIIISLIFIKVFSISYFRVISKSSEYAKTTKYKLTKKKNSPLSALIKKDFKKFLASPVYIVHAGFGLIIFVIATIAVSVNFEGTLGFLNKNVLMDDAGVQMQNIIQFLPIGFLSMLLFTILMSMITSSSISIEGKSFEILKTLPVSPKKILLSKVLMSNIIILIPTIICSLIISIRFNFEILMIVQIILLSLLLANFTSTLGLIVNLIFPKMDAKNDTEVIKQSISSLIATFSGMAIFGIIVSICFGLILIMSMSINTIFFILIGIFSLLNICNYFVLSTYGAKKLFNI